MRKLNKKILSIIVLLLSFFVGINNIKALECIYKLPFSGIDAKSGRYFKPSNEICYQPAGLHFCSFTATVNSYIASSKSCSVHVLDHYGRMDWNDRLVPAGYRGDAMNISSSNATTTKYYLYKMVGFANSSSDLDSAMGNGIKKVIKGNEKCPKYLIAKKTTNNLFIQNSSAYKKIFDDVASGTRCTAGDNANRIEPLSWHSDGNGKVVKENYYVSYQGSDDDSKYRNYLQAFYNIKASNSGDNSISGKISSTNEYVLPYYTKKYSGGESQIEQVEDAKAGARVYVETFDNAWYNRMVKYQNSLNSNCGSDWYKYINRLNYGMSSNDLFVYTEKKYKKSNLKENDKGISEKCWNARSDFFKAFESMQLFMYGMGANTMTEFEQISNVQADTIEQYTEKLKQASSDNASDQNLYYRVYLEDDTRVQHFKYLLYFFEGVKVGTSFTPEEFRSAKNELVNQKNDSQYRLKVIQADQCAYKCKNVKDTDNYNSCKSSNSDYKKCVKALKKCNAKVCSDCISEDYGTAFTNCMKNCKKVDAKCMENNGIKNFEKDSEAALEKAKEAKDELDKAALYTFEPAALPTITFKTAKYEPNCSDVKVFTYLWKGATLLAPFLLIIFGSFDYFKAVMAADEQKMKESKKKFPLRLIALLLLIIVPALLRILLKNAGTKGAENITYLKCIATGDYGE